MASRPVARGDAGVRALHVTRWLPVRKAPAGASAVCCGREDHALAGAVQQAAEAGELGGPGMGRRVTGDAGRPRPRKPNVVNLPRNQNWNCQAE